MSNLTETTIEIGLIDSKPTIIRRLPEGTFHSLQKTVHLTPGEHWFPLAVQNEDGTWVNKKALTAKAYDVLRSIMGISIITPDTIVNSEGVTVGNPYIIRKGGLVDTVQYRVFALGRGPAGNWSAVDLTFVYSQQAYIAHDLYLKWTGTEVIATKPPETKEWGYLINNEDIKDMEPGWIAFPLAVPGMSLAIEMSHKEVLPFWRKYQEDQKFSERNAHSMAVRNAIRKLTGISYADDDQTVTITVWPQGDQGLEAMRDSIGNPAARIEGQVLAVQTVVDSAGTDDLQAARELDEKVREDLAQNDVVPLPQESRDDIITKIREAIGKIPGKHESDIVTVAVKTLGFGSAVALREKASVEQLKEFLGLII